MSHYNKNDSQGIPSGRPPKPLLFGSNGEEYYGTTKAEQSSDIRSVPTDGRWKGFWKKTRSKDSEFWQAVAAWVVVGITIPTVYYAIAQLKLTKDAVEQATIQSRAAQETLTVTRDNFTQSERPWIKVTHRLVSPLAFNVQRQQVVALATIEQTSENVGRSVALNVFSWIDIIPMDTDHSITSAKARQTEYCDANRHPQGTLSGEVLFPADPQAGNYVVGPTMDRVSQSVIRDERSGLNGKVGFIVVGCIFYRSPFDSKDAPTHQTRFRYFLGEPIGGAINPYVFPEGVAIKLALIAGPDGFSAD